MDNLKISYQNFPNFGFITASLPTDLYNLLLLECKNAKKKNTEMISGLSGAGVPKHYYLKDKNIIKNLNNFLFFMKDQYDKIYPGLYDIRAFTKPLPYSSEDPWINFQNKGEFIPNHIHNGIYSYTIWIKIPYESENELKNGGQHASCFEFNYLDILGNRKDHILKLGKKDEGKIIFFPSKLTHIVYPYYTTNNVRISISGNILFDTQK
jgi:hypothetical protein